MGRGRKAMGDLVGPFEMGAGRERTHQVSYQAGAQAGDLDLENGKTE